MSILTPKPLQGSKTNLLATLGQDGAWIRAPWNQPCSKMGSRGPETSKKGVFRPPRGFGTEFKMQISSSTEFEAEPEFRLIWPILSSGEFEATPSSKQRRVRVNLARFARRLPPPPPPPSSSQLHAGLQGCWPPDDSRTLNISKSSQQQNKLARKDLSRAAAPRTFKLKHFSSCPQSHGF